jgi:hypothetical protein
MVLVQDETILVDYEPDFAMLYFERQDGSTNVTFREAMEKILEMVQAKKVRFWLINLAHSQQIPYEDQAWLLEKLDLSFFESHALEKVAMVPPRDLYTLMATESIMEHMLEHSHFEFQYFSEVASARDWLEESFREVCFYDEGLDIEYDAYHHWIYANWKGVPEFAYVKRGCELVFDLLKAKGCCKLLNDNRMALGEWSESAPWLSEDWIPRLEQHGMKAIAWVLSTSTVHRFSAFHVLESLDTDIRIEIFNEISRAKQWLHAV